MSTKQINNNKSIFDIAFFKFSFSIVSKKISIYLSTLLYFLLVISCTTIVPAIAQIDPIQLFTMQTTAMFLMLCVAIVASFIAIEIFRTSIDDGTELLTVSKPISRKEIVFAKLVIFLIYIIIISIISTGLSGFMFLVGYGSKEDNLKILLGILVATLINGIIFGSIATILSLFFKKIISLLITLSIAFILIVYSLLGSFVVKSPMTLMQQNDVSITPFSLVEVNKNKKVNVLQGMSIPVTSVGNKEIISDGQVIKNKPSDIWNKYKNESSYNKFAISDFGYQLSSIYTLGRYNANAVDALKRMSIFNSPVDFQFTDYDINSIKDTNDYFAKINIGISDKLPTTYFPELKTAGLVMNKNGSSKINNETLTKYNTKVTNTDYQISQINVNKNEELSWDYIWSKKLYNVSVDFDNSNPVENQQMTMNNYIDSYVNHVRNKKSTTGKLSPADFKDLASIFMKEYFEEEVKIKSSDDIISDLNSILYSGFYKLAFNQSNSEKSNIKIVSLSSIIDFYKDIDPELTFGEIYKTYGDDPDDPINQPFYIQGGKSFTIKGLIDLFLYGENSSQKSSANTKWSEVANRIDTHYKDTLKVEIENNAKERNQNRTILSLLGVKLDGYIDNTNSDISRYLNPSQEYKNNFINISNNGTYFTFIENGKVYANTQYRPSVTLTPTNLLLNFQKAKVIYTLDSNIVIIVWTMISLIIFAATMILYSRRDFA